MNGLEADPIPGLPGPVSRSLGAWHDMVAAIGSGGPVFEGLEAIVHADAVFRSPVAHKPYRGRQAVCLILRTVSGVFEDFVYHRQFATPDGTSVVLEFTAKAGGRELTGADFIRFDADGMITEFMVMIRPATGLMALGEVMGKALAGHETVLKP